ncbi:hypothetical protein OF83DRAFT_861529 [Amylostereum chailletii]|nr:hypothetical protein OF83DRAFT_861529 [Amylostereum chailletii]
MTQSTLLSSIEPPPQADVPAAADAARLRVTPSRRLIHFPSMPNVWSPKSKRLKSRSRRTSDDPAPPSPTRPSMDSRISEDRAVRLGAFPSVNDELPEDEDVYRWAILHENQRGITLFSTPYYSPLSLLPHDPPPFTIPGTDGSKSLQPEVSLDDYPLPDGTWRWVSHSWMIDMRDEGEVQYDGFQYNWFFRQHKWRSEVGKLNSGGWVRRRRWIRLMMRPARNEQVEDESSLSSRTGSSIASEESQSIRPGDVWKGDEDDWNRCHLLMHQLNRDGRRLELWRSWLGTLAHISPPRAAPKQWSEDEYLLPSETTRDQLRARIQSQSNQDRPPMEYIGRVIQKHVGRLGLRLSTSCTQR